MADEILMRLIDAYADAAFDQGLHQRTKDDSPESKRQAIVKYLAATPAPAEPVAANPYAHSKNHASVWQAGYDAGRRSLAATPAPAPQPLTDEQIVELLYPIYDGLRSLTPITDMKIARAIERAHGIGASTGGGNG